jgi:chemotaxis-related protein WspB
MLLLPFYIGTEKYSILAKDIVEILPLTQLKKIPRAPDFISGLLDYRGTPSPIIDLCALIEERSCNKILSSRIIMINYIDSKKQSHVIGITCEKVTETFDIKRDDFFVSGITLEEAPYLGAVANKDENMIQYIEINNLLPEPVQSILFKDKN